MKPWFEQPRVIADPYPVYARLRAQPVQWEPAWGAWLVTGYREVARALKDPRLSVELLDNFLARVPESCRSETETIRRTVSNWMLYLDPPRHTRLRAQVGSAFTPRIVQQMEAHVAHLVKDLLDGLQGDLMAELALPLPALSVAAVLGADLERREDFLIWSRDLANFIGSLNRTEEVVRRTERSLAEIESFFTGLMEERKARPREDLMSALVETDLFSEEIVALCSLLFLAGHETTTNLLGNGLLALLLDRAARGRFLEQPESAVEELLRFDSPSQFACRLATEDVELGGMQIRQGQFLNLGLAAANRDPAVFEQPNRLNLGRQDNRHLAFGRGPHYCVGAALARLEARVAITALLTRFPDLELADTVLPRQLNLGYRGLLRLPVRLKKGAARGAPKSSP